LPHGRSDPAKEPRGHVLAHVDLDPLNCGGAHLNLRADDVVLQPRKTELSGQPAEAARDYDNLCFDGRDTRGLGWRAEGLLPACRANSLPRSLRLGREVGDVRDPVDDESLRRALLDRQEDASGGYYGGGTAGPEHNVPCGREVL